MGSRCAFGYSSGLFILYLLLMSFISQYPCLVQLDDLLTTSTLGLGN